MYQNKYHKRHQPELEIRFYRSANGTEPVRDWLRELPASARKTIGEDMKTVQFGWPLGMPLVRKLEQGLWEVRSDVVGGIARVIFTIVDKGMVLLHAFVKKSQRVPQNEIATARRRVREVKHG